MTVYPHDYKDFKNVKKMYEKESIQAFLDFCQSQIDNYYDKDACEDIDDVGSGVIEFIKTAMPDLALDICSIMSEREDWHEEWDYNRSNEDNDMIWNYKHLSENHFMKLSDEKEKLIEAEKGLIQGMISFYLVGNIDKNFYRNDSAVQMKKDIEEQLEKIGVHNPFVLRTSDIPVRYSRQKKYENVSKTEIESIFQEHNVESAVLHKIKSKDSTFPLYDIKIIKEDNE